MRKQGHNSVVLTRFRGEIRSIIVATEVILQQWVDCYVHLKIVVITAVLLNEPKKGLRPDSWVGLEY